MKLDDKDKKLIVLAMDAGAAVGEISNAALALFRRWRARYKDGFELVKNIEATPVPAKNGNSSIQREACGRMILHFGKHKGHAIRDIPIDYLLWVLRNCANLNQHTREAINIYLGRSK